MKSIVKKTGCWGLLTLLIASFSLVQADTANPATTAPAAASIQNEVEMVDINTADTWTLQDMLEGIGPKKAAAIVEFRQKNGPFKELYELEQVYGIGRKTIEKNQHKIKIVIPDSDIESTDQKDAQLEEDNQPAVKPPVAETPPSTPEKAKESANQN